MPNRNRNQLGHFGPGSGGAAPPVYQGGQQQPDQIFMHSPPRMLPSPPQPPRPPGTDIPLPTPGPSPPSVGGNNMPGNLSWFGFGSGSSDRFGMPGGQIGPPEQGQAGYGPGSDYYRNYLETLNRNYGYGFDPNWQPSSINNQYPGLNQPAPYPLNQPGLGDPYGQPWRPRVQFPNQGGQSTPPNIRSRQPRQPRPGGGFTPPIMPPMGQGQGMGWMPRPAPPPTISGPFAGSGSNNPLMPPGTNPWEIPGARSGGSYILPPGTALPPGGEDISARIAADSQSVEQAKDAFRQFIASGGDPYGPTTPDWMNYNRRGYLS